MSILSDKRVASLHGCFWLHDPRFAGWLVEHLTHYGTSICDVGAGNGSMIRHLASRFSEVIAIEPSPAAFRTLKRRAMRLAARAIEASVEDIPLQNSSVDVVLAKSSYHHFKNPKKGLCEMRRVAKRLVAIVEVIAPSPRAFAFARKILPLKEPGRSKSAVFSETDLKLSVSKVAKSVRCLHYDQYIDIDSWLTHSDLSNRSKLDIERVVSSQPESIKDDMHIHYREGRLVMLRRMALVTGIVR